jgi:hypothetical protein
VQKGAWHASYKLPPGTEKWCTHGSVQCVAASDVIGAPGASMGALRCPSAIEVACPCTPAGCNDLLGPCRANLHQSVSLRERATHQGACCYDLPRQCVPPYVGRPVLDGAQPVCATPMERRDWAADLDLDLEGLGPDPARAELWTRIGGLEHSSVASFAKATLDLMALGAPPELLLSAARAGQDEIEHARLAYAVARAFGAGEVGPGVLPLLAWAPPDLVSFAVTTFREGCVVETTGALVARRLATAEPEPALAAVLVRIAGDEERHAELAWRTLAGAVRVGGRAVAEALRAEGEALPDDDSERGQVVRDLVRPCLSALLDDVEAGRGEPPRSAPTLRSS